MRTAGAALAVTLAVGAGCGGRPAPSPSPSAEVRVPERGPSREAREAYDRARGAVGDRDYARAAREFSRAVELAPAFADARFNLAATLQDLGRNADAAPHCRAYLALDAGSEWADIARSRLGSP